MKTEDKKNKCNIDDHGNHKKHAKQCDKSQKGRHHNSAGFDREDKRILKKRIVKLLEKKGRVSFEKLLHKLDIQPSVLTRALAKLENKGVVAKVENGFKAGEKGHGHHHHCHGPEHHHPSGGHKHKSGHHSEKRQHARKNEGHIRAGECHHGKREKQAIGSCRFALNSAL